MPQQFIKVKENVFAETSKPPQPSEWKSDSVSNLSNSNSDICRICHCEADLDNPLLSPCYCSGSLKYVHQACLIQWLAASDTRSCELCKFNFILHTKIKPLSEWRILEMSSVERRRLFCAILFHFVAAVCVIWSLFVLIDRAAEEVQKGLIAWPFWTKLVVVAVGFTGGAVFMYIQCRQYLHLFSRWKAHNRIILVQNAPEKPSAVPPSPNYLIDNRQFIPMQSMQTNADRDLITPMESNGNSRSDLFYVFESEISKKRPYGSSSSSIQKADVHVEDLDTPQNERVRQNAAANNFHCTEPNLRASIVALDIECSNAAGAGPVKKFSLPQSGSFLKTDSQVRIAPNVFKSMPNLSTSNENLLV